MQQLASVAVVLELSLACQGLKGNSFSQTAKILALYFVPWNYYRKLLFVDIYVDLLSLQCYFLTNKYFLF